MVDNTDTYITWEAEHSPFTEKSKAGSQANLT